VDNLWKKESVSLPVEDCGKTAPLRVDKKCSQIKAFSPLSTKVFPTTTVTKKRLVYVMFPKNILSFFGQERN
jgi:hypothetical protein